MQIYTNFESNSQLKWSLRLNLLCCFRCKFTQILKAIHNRQDIQSSEHRVVSDANLHKFWKQFTTANFVHKFFFGCFRCKFTQILKAIHNAQFCWLCGQIVVSDANLHKFWKQFTTLFARLDSYIKLFPMQIYTNFESNSQHLLIILSVYVRCFRCKFTQILKAIHNVVSVFKLCS